MLVRSLPVLACGRLMPEMFGPRYLAPLRSPFIRPSPPTIRASPLLVTASSVNSSLAALATIMPPLTTVFLAASDILSMRWSIEALTSLTPLTITLDIGPHLLLHAI